MRVRWIVLAAVLIALASAAAWVRASVHGHEQQINNLETFKAYDVCLEEYRAAFGRYPASLDGVRECWLRGSYAGLKFGSDWWGHAIKYDSRGSAFVLVSLGRDGKSDGLDPWQLRELNSSDDKQRRTCGYPDADQVMSDRGFHRACFK